MYVIIYITASSPEEAERIGEAVVKERLAACANVVSNLRSCYWWKGKVEKSKEALLLLKTKKAQVKKIIKRVRELHSYENPAIVAIPILAGSREYLAWVGQEIK